MADRSSDGSGSVGTGSVGTGSDEVTRPLYAGETTASGLPSRAARGNVAGERSLLDGPSFDGFSVPARSGRDEETEAFHPGHQSPVPSRPRHAAPGEQPTFAMGPGNAPGTAPGSGTGAGDEGSAVATPRFQPMAPQPPIDPEATTNLGFGSGAFSPAQQAEAAERRAAFGRAEAERRAQARSVSAGPGSDQTTDQATEQINERLPEHGPDHGHGQDGHGQDGHGQEPSAEDRAEDQGPRSDDPGGWPRRDNPPMSPWAEPPRERG